MSTAEESAANFHAVSNDSALAVFANRRNRLDCTFKAVESVMGAGCCQFETFVIVIATNLANRHTNLLS